LVNIPIEDLAEYGINEGETVELAYSISYIHKMCATTKLATEMSFSISASYPMRIKYDLGNDSHVMFYLAPKI
jgi:proliferating cell nuclear antigen